MVSNLATSPIIIYGAPRSGTTYLAEILNKHPDVFIGNEMRLFMWLHWSLNILPEDRELLLEYREDFLDYLRAVYPDLIRNFYGTLRPQALYWGDKYPHYSTERFQPCLETIADVFPGSRFVHIIRDGRDVVASLLRQRFPNGEAWVDFEEAHHSWTTSVDIGCAFGQRQPPGCYFELRYEDLVTDDVGVARTLFDFLGIEVHPNVEMFCREQQARRTPFSWPSRDLSTGATNSDRGTLLSRERQLRSLDLLGTHLVRRGYALVDKPGSDCAAISGGD